MKNISRTLSNKQGYDYWSSFYDEYPNPTIVVDEFHFPKTWKHITRKRILEIGCGTGRHTRKLLAQGNEVVGIDLSSGMLASASSKLNGDNIELIEGDFLLHERFTRPEFDAAISSLVIEHIRNLPAFFKKLNTVLNAEGTFYLSELHPLRAANGSLAHFKDLGSGEEVYLESFAHSDSEIKSAATTNQFEVTMESDAYGDHALSKVCPKWEKYLDKPMIKMWAFKKNNAKEFSKLTLDFTRYNCQ